MAGRKRLDPESEAAMEVVRMEQRREELKAQEQAERESRIAECHQFIGRIQAVGMVGKLATVSRLVWLKGVKESKIYRDLPGIGTWDKFCESLGKSRRVIDEDLQNLEVLGQDFLATARHFRVGYRDLRKLRRFSSEGVEINVVDEMMIRIGDEDIPLDPEHREDLAAAIERIIEAKNGVIEERDAALKTKGRLLDAKADVIQRQEKDLARLEKEARAKGLTPTEEAFIQRMENLRISFDGYMLKVDPERFDDIKKANNPTARMRSAYLTTLDYMRKQLLVAHSVATDLYGDTTLCPEDAWQPERGWGEES